MKNHIITCLLGVSIASLALTMEQDQFREDSSKGHVPWTPYFDNDSVISKQHDVIFGVVLKAPVLNSHQVREKLKIMDEAEPELEKGSDKGALQTDRPAKPPVSVG